MSIETKRKNAGFLFDMFEASEEGEVPINSKGPETRSRFPGDKRPLTTSTMVTIDCGNNYATIYLPDKDKVEVISRDQLLSLPNLLAPGTTLVGEASHIGTPQGESSLSQPFKEEMLLEWYKRLKDNDIDLKLFPQKSTPRACGYAKLEKSDINDPKAIYILLQDFPQISLMNPPSGFAIAPVVQEGWDFKTITNNILNIQRAYTVWDDVKKQGVKIKYRNPEDANFLWAKENIVSVAEQLNPVEQSVFGLDDMFYKVSNKTKGFKKGDLSLNKVNEAQFYSVLATLRDEKGNLRKREITGELPGWQFVKRRIFCMTPFHFRGGVARSNLYYHGATKWIADRVKEHGYDIKGKKRGGGWHKDGTPVEGFTAEEDRLFVQYRIVYFNAVRKLFQVLKRMLEKNDC